MAKLTATQERSCGKIEQAISLLIEARGELTLGQVEEYMAGKRHSVGFLSTTFAALLKGAGRTALAQAEKEGRL